VPGVWWKPAHKAEKVWVSIAFGWCIVLFAMMPLWHWKGGQNPSGVRTRVDPKAYYARTTKFAAQYKVGEDRGLPIVAPPPGAEVYLVGLTFQWYPILQLQQGKEYMLHMSSLDVNHGFAVFDPSGTFVAQAQMVPGYDTTLRLTFTKPGKYVVRCFEYCGIGHAAMVGAFRVVGA